MALSKAVNTIKWFGRTFSDPLLDGGLLFLGSLLASRAIGFSFWRIFAGALAVYIFKDVYLDKRVV
jgi:hypothetical protein